MALALYFITSCIGEILIGLLHFLVMVLLFFRIIFDFFHSICFNEILLHQAVNLLLFLSIFSQLILHKARKLLLLSDLYFSIESLQTSLHLDLLHVKIEHLFIAHFVITHENALAKFLYYGWCMYQAQTGLCSCTTSTWAQVPLISDAIKSLRPWLRVRVRNVHIAVCLIRHVIVHNSARY